MNRMSAKQRAKFAAMGIKYPTSTIAPKQPKKTAARQGSRPKSTDPDKATVDAAMKRAAGKCESCGDPLCGRRGFEYSVHHRKRRSQGGDNRLSNLVVLCGHGTSGCHGACHSEVERARQAGFLLRSTENPEEVPMEHAKGTVLLDNDGGYAVIQATRIEENYVEPF